MLVELKSAEVWWQGQGTVPLVLQTTEEAGAEACGGRCHSLPPPLPRALLIGLLVLLLLLRFTSLIHNLPDNILRVPPPSPYK